MKKPSLAVMAVGVFCVMMSLGSTATADKENDNSNNAQICQPQSAHLEPPTTTTKSLLIDAPEGKVIVGTCVKAGSSQQGDGPEYATYDPGVTSVTISHPSGKDISHYTVTYADAPESTTPPTETTTTTTTTTTVPEVTITVPATTEPPRGIPTTTEVPIEECVNINTSSVDALTQIIHIDEVRANEIVSLRPFSSIEDLVRVNGIASIRLADILAQGVVCAIIDPPTETTVETTVDVIDPPTVTTPTAQRIGQPNITELPDTGMNEVLLVFGLSAFGLGVILRRISRL